MNEYLLCNIYHKYTLKMKNEQYSNQFINYITKIGKLSIL